jgi:hypothetical protein
MKFFLLLFLLSTVRLVTAVSYSTRYPCTIKQMPVVVLQQDVKSGNMSVYKRLEPNADITTDEFYETGQLRILTMEEMAFMVNDNYPSFLSGYIRLGSGGDTDVTRGLVVSEADTVATSASANMSASPEEYAYFYARECNCFQQWAPVVFCPLTIHTCLRGNWDAPPGCRNTTKAQSFAWSMQMLSLAGFVVLAVCCCQREGTGANSRDLILSLCIPRYREHLADRILQRNPRRAYRLYRSRFLDQQAEMLQRHQWIASMVSDATVLPQQVDRQRPVQQVELREMENQQVPSGKRTSQSTLLLRTTVYRQNRQPSEDEIHDDACAICCADLVDGDRVGVLEVCRHQFHVECLKPWLQRRNMCPLCQKEGIAKLHHEIGPSSEMSTIESSVEQGPIEGGTN